MRTLVLLVLAFNVLATSARAQEAREIVSGMRVRAKLFASTETGRVESVSSNAFALRRDRDSTVITIPAATVDSMDVSLGKRGNFWTGLFLGYVGMIAIGIVAEHPGMEHSDLDPTMEGILYGLTMPGTPVAIIAGLLGAAHKSERWKRVRFSLRPN